MLHHQDVRAAFTCVSEVYQLSYNVYSILSLYDIRERDIVLIHIIKGLYASRHALKHGLALEDIEYAWVHFIARRNREEPNETTIVAIGPRRNGNLIQMVGVEESFGIVIYHAMEPPTQKVLAELNMQRR